MMTTLRHIAMLVATLVVAVASVSCGNDTDTVLNNQQTAISRYLTGSHQPKLIAESELSGSMTENPAFYTQWGLDIYRYISTYYNEGRDQMPEIDWDDTIEITYSAYIFNSGKPTITDLFATNDEEMIVQLENLGLNTSYEWTSEPMTVHIGSGEMLDSLEKALVGCREGDSVEVYLTYDAAYGKHHIGMVPSKSAQVWYIDILTVTK